MLTLPMILQISLVVLSASFHHFAAKPPRKIPDIPRPPPQAPFTEKVVCIFMRIVPLWAQLERGSLFPNLTSPCHNRFSNIASSQLEVHIAAIFEILFITNSGNPAFNKHLPEIVTRTRITVVPWTLTTVRFAGILMQITGGWIRITCHRSSGYLFYLEHTQSQTRRRQIGHYWSLFFRPSSILHGSFDGASRFPDLSPTSRLVCSRKWDTSCVDRTAGFGILELDYIGNVCDTHRHASGC